MRFSVLSQLVSIAVATFSIADSVDHFTHCKCAPTDNCWLSLLDWESLNCTVSGALIQDTLPAIVCYPGPQQNLTACADLVVKLTNSTFIADDPIALGYPILDACPVVDFAAGQTPDSCSLGDSPRFTVNATTPTDVVAAVNFARENNIRLVVRNTGHDILGRSTGYGSLQIRNLRQGITFQQTYSASDKCTKSSWTGSAFSIAGGYVWEDVHAEAAARNVIVVSGGDPSVGCIGGYAQGGGPSPASRNYGLAADQILEVQVVLANGDVVTANTCQNTDLFFIRGGGCGTYGLVVSTTIKAHPPSSVVAQTFDMAPLIETAIPQFMDARAVMYAAYPDLNDAGYSGYGSWSVESPYLVFGNSTTGYTHTIALFGQSISEAQDIFAPVATQLEQYNGQSLVITVKYLTFPTYSSYYNTLSGVQQPVGYSGAAGSRFIDRASLTNSSAALKKMLNVTAGNPGELAASSVSLVSGGQVFKDASDPNSGVNPAWRTCTQAAIHHDVTYNKIGAMRALARNTGCYMNEADRLDPLYLQDFYGENTEKLEAIKTKYDPQSVFYCYTCIGSEKWAEDSIGRLCRI